MEALNRVAHRFRDRTMLVGSAGLNALTGHGIDPDARAVWPLMV